MRGNGKVMSSVIQSQPRWPCGLERWATVHKVVESNLHTILKELYSNNRDGPKSLGTQMAHTQYIFLEVIFFLF